MNTEAGGFTGVWAGLGISIRDGELLRGLKEGALLPTLYLKR